MVQCGRSLRANPTAQLTEAKEDGRAAAPRFKVRWRIDDVPVAGHKALEQRPSQALAIVQEEVAKVECTLGAAGLSEVDDACVLSVLLEDGGRIEIPVGQAADLEAALSFIFD